MLETCELQFQQISEQDLREMYQSAVQFFKLEIDYEIFVELLQEFYKGITEAMAYLELTNEINIFLLRGSGCEYSLSKIGHNIMLGVENFYRQEKEFRIKIGEFRFLPIKNALQRAWWHEVVHMAQLSSSPKVKVRLTSKESEEMQNRAFNKCEKLGIFGKLLLMLFSYQFQLLADYEVEARIVEDEIGEFLGFEKLYNQLYLDLELQYPEFYNKSLDQITDLISKNPLLLFKGFLPAFKYLNKQAQNLLSYLFSLAFRSH